MVQYYGCNRFFSQLAHHLPVTTYQKRRVRHLRVCRSLKIFAKIDPKNSVDKLNKSKLTGNIVNVFKMVLPLVTWLAAGGGAAASA